MCSSLSQSFAEAIQRRVNEIRKKGGNYWSWVNSQDCVSHLPRVYSSLLFRYVERATLPTVSGDGRFILWKSGTKVFPDSGAPGNIRGRDEVPCWNPGEQVKISIMSGKKSSPEKSSFQAEVWLTPVWSKRKTLEKNPTHTEKLAHCLINPELNTWVRKSGPCI